MKTNTRRLRPPISGGPRAALLLLSALVSVSTALAANPPVAPPPAPPCIPPTHYTPPDNNGQWTPEQSKTADHQPGTPSDPRGFYPPVESTGNPSDSTTLGDLAEKINRLDPANRWYQGGKSITRIYDSAKKGEFTRVGVELADGVGRFASITEGAMLGAAKGAIGGWPGMLVGGMVGGWLGKTVWDQTGGRVNDYSRNALSTLDGMPPPGQTNSSGVSSGLPPGAVNVPGPNAGGPPPGGVHQGNPAIPLPPTSGGGYIGGGTSSGGGGSCPGNGSCPP